MKRILIAGLLAIFSSASQAASFDQSTWNGLLKKHVVSLRQGQATQMNYEKMAADRSQLKKLPFSGWHRLVYWYPKHTVFEPCQNWEVKILAEGLPGGDLRKILCNFGVVCLNAPDVAIN